MKKLAKNIFRVFIAHEELVIRKEESIWKLETVLITKLLDLEIQ